MLKKIFTYLDAVYPNLCICCDNEYPLENSCFCIDCAYELPFTHLHDQRDNIVEKYFWGRLMVEKATALLYFQKGEIVQDMLRRLKYKNKFFIGKALGKYFAEELSRSSFMKDIDMVIPIPIHKSKRRKRAYNQSAFLSEAIAEKFDLPTSEKYVIKKHNTTSQTRKSRTGRVENLMGSFEIKSPEKLKNKHVLIVDDILTTGSTLEAFGSLLVPLDCKISIAVFAIGKY